MSAGKSYFRDIPGLINRIVKIKDNYKGLNLKNINKLTNNLSSLHIKNLSFSFSCYEKNHFEQLTINLC